MRSHTTGTATIAAALALACEATPALAQDARIVDVKGDCGAAAPTLEMQGEGGFSLRFPALLVRAGGATRRARKNCAVELSVKPPAGQRVVRDGFQVVGRANVPWGARRSNLSVRYYAPGDPGSDLHEVFTAPRSFTASSDGEPVSFACGEEVQLTVLVDVTARAARGARAGSIVVSEVHVPTLLEECS